MKSRPLPSKSFSIQHPLISRTTGAVVCNTSRNELSVCGVTFGSTVVITFLLQLCYFLKTHQCKSPQLLKEQPFKTQDYPELCLNIFQLVPRSTHTHCLSYKNQSVNAVY
jgi:hypothetical protein